MLNAKSVICFVLTFGLSVSGQGLLRKAVVGVLGGQHVSATDFLLKHFLHLFLSPYFWGGIALSGVGLVCWLYVLSMFELSRAIPILGGIGYVLLFIVAKPEHATWLNFAGILAIVGGLYLVSMKPEQPAASDSAAATTPAAAAGLHLSPKQVPTNRAD